MDRRKGENVTANDALDIEQIGETALPVAGLNSADCSRVVEPRQSEHIVNRGTQLAQTTGSRSHGLVHQNGIGAVLDLVLSCWL